MSREKIENAITNIDDKYICEAINYKKISKMHESGISKIGRIVACFLVIVVLSATTVSVAVASGNMTAYSILYSLYPELAEKLTPVNVTCEDNDINMKVESVYIEGNKANIYISMEDLKGNRFDETIDLFDSYEINITGDSSGTCSLVSYDKEANIATFLIYIEQNHNKPILGSKLKFSISKILSKKKEFNSELSQISLEHIEEIKETQNHVNERGSSGIEETKAIGYLITDKAKELEPVHGVKITNYGFIDDSLHIQAYYDDISKTDNHGEVYLKDKQGNIIQSMSSVAFWDDEEKGSYEEYIFPIGPNDDLSGYTVWGDFITCGTLIEGQWKVTFPIKNDMINILKNKY